MIAAMPVDRHAFVRFLWRCWAVLAGFIALPFAVFLARIPLSLLAVSPVRLQFETITLVIAGWVGLCAGILAALLHRQPKRWVYALVALTMTVPYATYFAWVVSHTSPPSPVSPEAVLNRFIGYEVMGSSGIVFAYVGQALTFSTLLRSPRSRVNI